MSANFAVNKNRSENKKYLVAFCPAAIVKILFMLVMVEKDLGSKKEEKSFCFHKRAERLLLK